MPYKKYYRRNRRPAYRRRYVKRGRYPTSKLVRDVARLKDAVSSEYKRLEYQVNEHDVTWSGSNYTLNETVQGDGNDQHIGSSVKNQRISIRGCFKNSDTVTKCNVRMTILMDKQNTLNPSDVWAVIGNVGAPFSPKKDVTRFKSKILYDKVFSLSESTLVRNFSINLPLNFHTEFNNTANNIVSNSIKIVFVSDIDPALSPPTVTFVGHTSYTDN